MEQLVLDITTRAEFRAWLAANAATAHACYIAVKRGRPQDDGALYCRREVIASSAYDGTMLYYSMMPRSEVTTVSSRSPIRMPR